MSGKLDVVRGCRRQLELKADEIKIDRCELRRTRLVLNIVASAGRPIGDIVSTRSIFETNSRETHSTYRKPAK